MCVFTMTAGIIIALPSLFFPALLAIYILEALWWRVPSSAAFAIAPLEFARV